MESYDEIITFGRVLAHVWQYEDSDNLVSAIFGYLEGPHKWEKEYQHWRLLGGSLSDGCLEAFSDWYENRGRVEDDDETSN